MATDEEIRLRLIVEAQDAITRAKEFQELIRSLKPEIDAVAKAANASFANAAKAMEAAYKKGREQRAGKLYASGMSIEEANIKALEQEKVYADALKQAATQLEQEEKARLAILQSQNVELDKTKRALEGFKIDPAKLTAGIQQFQVEVEKIKQKMQEVSRTTGASFENIGKQIIADAKAAGASGEQLNKIQRAVNQASKELNAAQKETSGFAGALGKLGTIGSFVFGSVLGLSAITILRDIINYFKQAAVAGYEFSKSLFQLSAGINAIRRAGVDITFKDMMNNIRALKKEYPIFSIPELVKGASALINLTRDFGFAKEQIFELQDAIVKLAIINGRSMDEVQRTVALAISSGYTEGLQRLGVSINRITIAERAAALGYADSYMALTELQRAEATEILIKEKTALYAQDLNEYQKKLPGLIDASTASFEDLTAKLGLALLPTWALVMRFLQRAANFWTRVFGEALPKIMQNFTIQFMVMVGVIKQGWEIISGKRISIDWKKIGEEARKTADLVRGYFAGEAFILPEPEVNKEGLKEFTDEQLDAFEKLYKDLYSLTAEYNKKHDELQKDFLADQLDLLNEYLAKQKEIWKEYNDEVAKINANADEEISKENEQLSQDIQDLNRDTQNQVADANRKYHENEIKAERDYQEKLRRLREEFLFDLEDALRERDALQVLRLIRRYKLDKEQTTRQYEQEKQDRAEAYKQELEDIRRQAAEKLRELQIEHQRRLLEIESQRQKELAEAAQKRDEELAQERESWQQKNTERAQQYAQDLQALKDWLNESSTSIIQNFVDTLKGVSLTSDMIAKVISAVFGTGGLADVSMQEFNVMLTNAATQALTTLKTINDALAQTANYSGSILGGTPLAPNPLPVTTGGLGVAGAGSVNKKPTMKKASGATNMVLTRPKLIMAGEVPERVDITPLNQLGNKNGKGQLEIWLGAGLEGKIVDNALGQVEIVLRKELEKH